MRRAEEYFDNSERHSEVRELKNEIKKVRRNYPQLPGDPGILKDPNLQWTGELELGNRNKSSEYQQFKSFLYNLEEKRVITSAILFSIIFGVILLCWVSTCFKEFLKKNERSNEKRDAPLPYRPIRVFVAFSES